MKSKTEKTLWDMFSKFIRARDANYQGYVSCISCSTVKNWKQMDAGHFVPVGSDRALKYNEINVNGQCTSCNHFKSGNIIQYRPGLIYKYGEQKVKDLETSHYFKTTKKKLNQISINILYDLYKKKFEQLNKEKCL
jgi:hypothetical protein